ncbi:MULTISPECIES: DUF6059 family protein [Streptomyces]|uniref:DUF6059 family protein n=1 Tax=Streptomyces TaxID=1883 RepID=UPI001C8B4F70|nr:DUF6059 family protein [Streptomyces lateritius]MBX9427566.1 hypothetical protein [Streptomyces lateritius]
MTASSFPSPHAAEDRWPASALRLARRMFRSAYWTLSDFGWVWMGMTTLTVPLIDVPPHDGPPPGHPERLSALPLTPVERALERQLTG